MKQLIALMSAGLIFIAFGCAMETQDADNTGSLSLDLVVAGGAEIDEVDYEITGDDIPAMAGTIDTSAPGSTASVEVFGLPAGSDYLIEMQAVSVDGVVVCLGSADFDVEVGVVTDVMVILNCRPAEELGGVRVNGKLNVCAQLAKVVVSPLQTSVGNDIDLAVLAFDEEGDPITYLWTATGGSIADPTATTSTYTCEEIGEQTVSVQVSDDGDEFCSDDWTIAVRCVDGAP